MKNYYYEQWLKKLSYEKKMKLRQKEEIKKQNEKTYYFKNREKILKKVKIID